MLAGGEVLPYDIFVARIFEQLGLETAASRKPHDKLFADVGLDSLELFEMIMHIEAIVDREPCGDPPELVTLQDAYNYYLALCQDGARPT